MAEQASAASQEKSGGPQEARASVSLGSAGAGEEKLRALFQRDLWLLVRSSTLTSSE